MLDKGEEELEKWFGNRVRSSAVVSTRADPAAEEELEEDDELVEMDEQPRRDAARLRIYCSIR